MKELHKKSTKVVQWYAHPAEVRGPFGRWLHVSEIPEQYRKHCGSQSDDATYAAYAMNWLPKLIECVEDLRKQRDELELQLGIENMVVAGKEPGDESATTG